MSIEYHRTDASEHPEAALPYSDEQIQDMLISDDPGRATELWQREPLIWLRGVMTMHSERGASTVTNEEIAKYYATHIYDDGTNPHLAGAVKEYLRERGIKAKSHQ